MKKLLSMILALTLVLAMAVPAFAADYTIAGSESKDVEADYTAPENIKDDAVYLMVISWAPTEETEALSYTGKNSTYTWNTTELIYKETVNNESEMGWAGAAGYKITVTNYSNAAVTAATSATNTYGLNLTEPTPKNATLGSAAVKTDGEAIEFTDTATTGIAQEAAFTYTYAAKDGATAPTSDTDKVTVGAITVSVSID